MRNDMEIYALLDVDEPPKRLKSFNSNDEFYYYFAPPLPRIVVLFMRSKYECKSAYDVKLVIDNSIEEKVLGTLSHKQSSLVWEGEWSKEETQRSLEISKSGRVLKLVVSTTDDVLNEKSDEGFFSQDVNQKDDLVEENNEIDELQNDIDKFEQEFEENKSAVNKLHRDTPDRKSIKDFFKKKPIKSKGKENISTNIDIFDFDESESASDEFNKDEVRIKTPISKPCGKRRSPFCTSALHDSKKQYKPKKDSQLSRTLQSPTLNVKSSPTTPKFSDILHNEAPSCRWGHTLCAIVDDKAVVLGGQGPRQQMCSDSLWLLNTKSFSWKKQLTNNPSIDRRMGHSVVYDDKAKLLYVYGGSKHKKWYNDVYTLDIDTWIWTKLETTGKAPTRAYHSCSNFYDELLIFGGVFPNPDPVPDGCSNELLIFDKVNKSWYAPIVTGDVPSPRSGHSACIIDNKLFIFAGWDAPNCYNDMFMLDLGIMQFKKISYSGSIPSPRTWHSTTLSRDRKQICIYGGYDGDNALGDVFVFNSGTNVWSNHSRSPMSCRAGHAVFAKPNSASDNEETMFIFGGGDNNGEFFNDLVQITL